MKKRFILVAIAAVFAVPALAQADESTVLHAKNDDYSLMLGGRIQADYATYFNKSFLAPNGSVTEMGAAGAKLRRARIFTAGKIGKDWKFKFQYVLTDNKVSSWTIEFHPEQ